MSTEAIRFARTTSKGRSPLGRDPACARIRRARQLRRAFAAVMKDPDYRADARKQQLETDFMLGEDIAKLVERIYASPAAVVARARTALEDGKKITKKR